MQKRSPERSQQEDIGISVKLFHATGKYLESQTFKYRRSTQQGGPRLGSNFSTPFLPKIGGPPTSPSITIERSARDAIGDVIGDDIINTILNEVLDEKRNIGLIKKILIMKIII